MILGDDRQIVRSIARLPVSVIIILIPGKRITGWNIDWSILRNIRVNWPDCLLPLLLFSVQGLLYLLALDPMDQEQHLLIRRRVFDLAPGVLVLDIVPPIFVSLFAAHYNNDISGCFCY